MRRPRQRQNTNPHAFSLKSIPKASATFSLHPGQALGARILLLLDEMHHMMVASTGDGAPGGLGDRQAVTTAAASNFGVLHPRRWPIDPYAVPAVRTANFKVIFRYGNVSSYSRATTVADICCVYPSAPILS